MQITQLATAQTLKNPALRLFGEEGFGKMVERVASIEKSLGIYDLAQFTPHG